MATGDKKKLPVKRAIGFVLAAFILIVGMNIAESDQLSLSGVRALTTLLVCVVLWFFESLPSGVVGVLAGLLLFLTGAVGNIGEGFSGFTSSTVWFVFGIFCLTAIMMKSSIGFRLSYFFIKWAGKDSSKLVLAMMIGSALVSSVMTDTGAVVLSMSIVMPLLKAVGAKPLESNLGKALLLGIAFAAVLGGFSTPFGHVLNVLGLGMLEAQTGLTVGFFQWVSIGVPIAAVMVGVCWFFIVRAFPPEELSDEAVNAVLDMGKTLGPWTALDKKSLAVIVAVPVLLIVGNWVPALSSAVVCLAAMGVVFVPGVDILEWKDYEKAIAWPVILMVGGVMCLGNAVESTGGGTFLANLFLNSGIMELNILVALLIITTILYLIHTFCPIALALAALFLPPLFVYSQAMGIPPAIPVFLMSAVTAGNFLVPLNPTIIVTYGTGYYRFGDVAKAGWPSAIIFVALSVFWSYFVGGLVL